MALQPDEPTTQHFGFNIPTRLMNLTGGGPETFDAISDWHARSLAEHIPIAEYHTVLEIGCGIGRDAIQLAKMLSRSGRYIGIDIIPDSIEWCSANISTLHPNFRFVHFDVKDQLHNPEGIASTADITIPCASRSVDRIFLWSVFTHMNEADILHYLREFARLLRPNGLVFATWFIVNDDILAKARTVDRTPFGLRFEHQLNDHCYINDQQNPMGAIAYTRPAIEQMISAADLALAKEILPGDWSGYYAKPKSAQDVTILKLNHLPA